MPEVMPSALETRTTTEQLTLLDEIRQKILNLFSNEAERTLAEAALFSPVYTGENGHHYFAPNIYALPYLVKIWQTQGVKAADLTAIPCDMTNMQNVNMATGSDAAGNLAIALSIAKLSTPDSICVRYAGDELLILSKTNNLDPYKEISHSIQKNLEQDYPVFRRYPCHPKYKPGKCLKDIRLRAHRKRLTDLAASMYFPEERHKGKSAASFLGKARDSGYMTPEERALIPPHFWDLIEKADDKNRAKQLTLQTIFDEKYSRHEPVFQHNEFYNATKRIQSENLGKKYRMVMFGPIGVKDANSIAHSLGDEILIHASTKARIHFENALICQDRGSFFAYVEETPDIEEKIQKLNHELTAGQILQPIENIDNPGIIFSLLPTDVPTDTREAFWQALDEHRPLHYLKELDMTLQNFDVPVIEKLLRIRFASRISQLRELVLTYPKIPLNDLEFLEVNPSEITDIEEFLTYTHRLRNLLGRLDHPKKILALPSPHSHSSSA